jgi:catechol 2,3-dioxygenase-like lactoylglutathione lyase family enzyme
MWSSTPRATSRRSSSCGDDARGRGADVKASVYHLQINVRDAGVSMPFYRDLLGYLEYRVMVETSDLLGMSNGTTDLWLVGTPAERTGARPHRKNAGLNHIAFRVGARADVDRFHDEFLKPRAIPVLYGGPREYPEYRPGYYATFFEDPDRLKLEVVYIP